MSTRYGLVRILEIAGLDPMERYVVMTWWLVTGEGRRPEVATPKLIAQATDLNQDVVRRKLRSLEEKGLLVSAAPGARRKGGRGNVSVYRLNFAAAIGTKGLGLFLGLADPGVPNAANAEEAGKNLDSGSKFFPKLTTARSGNYDSQSETMTHSPTLQRELRPTIQVSGSPIRNKNIPPPMEGREARVNGNGNYGRLAPSRATGRRPARSEAAVSAVKRAFASYGD